MFPRREPTLSIKDISEFWSREIIPRATSDELSCEIEKAWWRGDLECVSPSTRINLLRTIAQPLIAAIVPVATGNSGPVSIKELTDGGMEVDIRPRIRVASLIVDDWNDDNCRDAFRIVSDEWARVREFDGIELVLPILFSIRVSHKAFFEWIGKQGFAAPKFWAKPLHRLDELLCTAAANHPSGTLTQNEAAKIAQDAGVLTPREEVRIALKRLQIGGKQGRKKNAVSRRISAKTHI